MRCVGGALSRTTWLKRGRNKEQIFSTSLNASRTSSTTVTRESLRRRVPLSNRLPMKLGTFLRTKSAWCFHRRWSCRTSYLVPAPCRFLCSFFIVGYVHNRLNRHNERCRKGRIGAILCDGANRAGC